MTKKITIIGRANVGKTSITKMIFESEQPKTLMIYPLSPTRGIVSELYQWLDLELALFDTSGQELPYLLKDKEEQSKAFGDADAVIYIFDYPNWTIEAENIIEEIKNLFKIIKIISPNTLFYLICHKVDLINKKYKNNFNLMKIGVKNRIGLPETIVLYFTSIYPELYFSTFNAFSQILSNFSKNSMELNNTLDEVIHKYSSVICFLIGNGGKIISQSITNDITPQSMDEIYFIINDFFNIGGTGDVNKEQKYVDSGTDILTFTTHVFETSDIPVEKMLLFSKNLDRNEVLNIRDEIILKIQHYSNKK
jgi:GTPase SAR1 family protein